MPYIIDGHNLIPKIPGLSLRAVDDEMQLVELLQEFCRLQRKQVEVFFDNAPPGQPRARNFGQVTARFVREENTADAAIRRKLARLGRSARNWTVVSSDLAVQAAARAVRAQVLSSEEFAKLLLMTFSEEDAPPEEKPDATVDPDELEDWLNLFGAGDEE